MGALVIRPEPATGADEVIVRVVKGQTAFLLPDAEAKLLSMLLFDAIEELESRLEEDRHYPVYTEEERTLVKDHLNIAALWAENVAPKGV